MIKEYKNKTNIGVGLGLVLQVAGQYLRGQGESMELIGLGVLVAGFLAFIWGCANYAMGKGYPQWLGALGLFSIFGLVVMVLLPDKHK